MLLPLLLLIQDAPALDAAVAAYRAKTAAEVPCRATEEEEEIVVCAQRHADRYRVPLTTTYNGREADGVRLARLLDTNPLPCGQGPFLVRCGAVGVGVGVSLGGGPVHYIERPLAR
jgi:hypothetical protein